MTSSSIRCHLKKKKIAHVWLSLCSSSVFSLAFGDFYLGRWMSMKFWGTNPSAPLTSALYHFPEVCRIWRGGTQSQEMLSYRDEDYVMHVWRFDRHEISDVSTLSIGLSGRMWGTVSDVCNKKTRTKVIRIFYVMTVFNIYSLMMMKSYLTVNQLYIKSTHASGT